MDAILPAGGQPVRLGQQWVATGGRGNRSLDHADHPDGTEGHSGRAGKGRNEHALPGWSQVPERSLHQLRNHLAEFGQGGAVMHAVGGGKFVQQSLDALPGIVFRPARVDCQVIVQQALGPRCEISPGTAISRRLQVIGEFVDKGSDVLCNQRFGSHAAGAGRADFPVGFPTVSIRGQALRVGIQPVTPLLPAADDASFPGDHVP